MTPSASTYTFKKSPYSSHTKIIDHFPAPGRGKRVLDLGCGNGYLAAILADRGYEVVGLEQPGGYDVSAFPKTVQLIEADLEDALPPLEPFDFILLADILEHLRRPDLLLAQVPALLKPGGRLLGSLPNSGNIYFRLTVLSGRFPQKEKGLFDRTHVRFFMWDGWRDLFRESGFEIERVDVTAIPVSLVIPDSALARLAELCFYFASKLWRTLFAYQFVVCARYQDHRP